SPGGRAVGRALAVTYGIGVILALWGTLSGPFNALGWVAVGLNLFLGSSFAWLEFIQPRNSPAPPSRKRGSSIHGGGGAGGPGGLARIRGAHTVDLAMERSVSAALSVT